MDQALNINRAFVETPAKWLMKRFIPLFARRTGNGRDIQHKREEVHALCVNTLLGKYHNCLFSPKNFTSGDKAPWGRSSSHLLSASLEAAQSDRRLLQLWQRRLNCGTSRSIVGAGTHQDLFLPVGLLGPRSCLHCWVGPVGNVASTNCDITCKPQAPPRNFSRWSTYPEARTWLGPIKVPVNGSLGEIPSVETRTKGPLKLTPKFLQWKCAYCVLIAGLLHARYADSRSHFIRHATSLCCQGPRDSKWWMSAMRQQNKGNLKKQLVVRSVEWRLRFLPPLSSVVVLYTQGVECKQWREVRDRLRLSVPTTHFDQMSRVPIMWSRRTLLISASRQWLLLSEIDLVSSCWPLGLNKGRK